MTTSILCAVDVNNGQEDLSVIKRAAQLATLDDAQLDVIAVVPDYGMSVVGGYFVQDHHDKMVEETKTHLNELVRGVLGEAENEKIRHVVATGRVYEEILNAAAQSGASLIVVGAHKADLKDYLLGPNASRIVRHANCSVYVVR